MKPSKGIKVIELAEYMAVSGAPWLLADQGAIAYRVERPQGDSSKYLRPPFKMIDFIREGYNHCMDMTVGGNR